MGATVTLDIALGTLTDEGVAAINCSLLSRPVTSEDETVSETNTLQQDA